MRTVLLVFVIVIVTVMVHSVPLLNDAKMTDSVDHPKRVKRYWDYWNSPSIKFKTPFFKVKFKSPYMYGGYPFGGGYGGYGGYGWPGFPSLYQMPFFGGFGSPFYPPYYG